MKLRFHSLLMAWSISWLSVTYSWSAQPTWWETRGVLTSGVPANDFAAANLGQLKQIATKAYDEIQLKVQGGAGVELSTLVGSWRAPLPPHVVRNDFAAVNIGQVKAIAKMFYDRLALVAAYHGPPLALGQRYPWTEPTSDDDDFALANVGQVKFAFSFEVPNQVRTPPAQTGAGTKGQ
jgi:hypothetical protein